MNQQLLLFSMAQSTQYLEKLEKEVKWNDCIIILVIDFVKVPSKEELFGKEDCLLKLLGQCPLHNHRISFRCA